MSAPAPPSPSGNLPSTLAGELPEIIHRAGSNAVFAAQEFFAGKIRNPHTRRAYLKAITGFLKWAEEHGGGELGQIAPWHVGEYFEQLAGTTSIATRNARLSALRHFFDNMVNRHAIALNPARTVRGEKLDVMEGRTPEIPIAEVRKLLASIDTSHIVGLRDRAILAALIYTTSRRSAVAKLRLEDYYYAGVQWMLHFSEKGGKSREIPVRHNLQEYIDAYIDAAGLRGAVKNAPLFQRAMKKQRQLNGTAMNGDDIYRMMKRRLKDFGMPLLYSPHSFRVTTITDLLAQGIPREDVQHLAGHADARTTGLYDRTKHKVKRNIVERISV
jgi:site-specific recombinase XerD